MLSSLCGLALLSTQLVSALVLEQIKQAPRNWHFMRNARCHERVQLSIFVHEQNLDKLEEIVLQVSDPDHPSYGQHLQHNEVRDLTEPSEEATEAVHAWLKEWNVTRIVDEGDLITFSTTVGNANRMLDTKFGWWEGNQKDVLRTLQYSIPDDLVEHVDFIHPTIMFGSPKPYGSAIHSVGNDEALASFNRWRESPEYVGATTPPPLALCAKTIIPQCLLELYNVHYGADANNGNKLAYASFLNESARYTDLTIFENTQTMYAKGKNFSVTTFAGGVNDQKGSEDSTEANLDNQYTISVAYPVPVTEFITAGKGPQIPDKDEPAGTQDNEPYVRFLAGIATVLNSELPQTLSVSYGEDEQTWPEATAKKVCTGFMKLAGRGVSVLFASGDFGPGETCANNAGTKKEYVPNFPASCPYVTTVGATESNSPEKAADFSGGGFSNYFAQPSYQSTVVNAYLKTLSPSITTYITNKNGRGYPDVSAQGVNFLVVDKGVTEPVDGTSAASPTFASIVTLLNSARISTGKAPLGFLNPFLYGAGKVGLTDITTGSTTGCTKNPGKISGAGFPAVKGWDAATGLGTPNFGKLLGVASPGTPNTGGVLAAS